MNDYGEHVVEYDHKEISLYEIFQHFGTVARPKLNPADDPIEPPKKEKKVRPPTPPPKELAEGEEPEEPKPEEKEEEEEPFVPPVDRVLWYDFSAHNGKDPILLALMVKGENDKFTL